MKRYGAVIMGGAERISVLAQSGATEQASTGVDPWGAILAGKTVDTVLAGLPPGPARGCVSRLGWA